MIPRRQGAAAEYGGKVPLPGAPANAPPEGVRRQGAAAGYARQCPSGGACGQLVQASIGRLAKPFTILGQITIYAAHKKGRNAMYAAHK